MYLIFDISALKYFIMVYLPPKTHLFNANEYLNSNCCVSVWAAGMTSLGCDWLTLAYAGL